MNSMRELFISIVEAMRVSLGDKRGKKIVYQVQEGYFDVTIIFKEGRHTE